MSDRRLWIAIGEILVLGLPLAAFLRHRGWTWARISEPVRPRDLLRGLGLWLSAVLVFFGLSLAGRVAWPHAPLAIFKLQVSGTFSLPPMLLAVVLDPIAEELLWLGYLVNVLRPRGLWLAAAISILLRTLVHAYQGLAALVGPLILGVLFTRYYLRSRRLVPVMVAHTIQDLLAFTVLLWSHRAA